MFQLEVTPKLTKEYLYEKIGQEKLMEHYTGKPVIKGLFVCPPQIRVDKKPTCSFYKNKKGVLIFKDFAGISGDVVQIVMHIFECSYYQAMRIIANDFGLISYSKMDKNPPKLEYTGSEMLETEPAKIQVELKKFSDKELKWWENYGITLDILKKFRVYSIKSLFLNGKYFSSSTDSSPIYGYYGGSSDLWRIYMPTKISYRFLSNWTSSMIQGVKQLPKTGDHLIITKSLKDVMSLYSFEINAIAPISETIVLTDIKYKKLSDTYNNIICFYDNDLAGVKGAQKYKKKYNSRCIFIKRQYAKDFSDLLKKVSNVARLEVINELKTIIRDKSITKTKYFYIFNGKKS